MIQIRNITKYIINMKKLPEKWCVKCNFPSGNNPVANWLNNNHKNKPNNYYNGSSNTYYGFDRSKNVSACSQYLPTDNYKEISFADFERLVLKKKVNYEIYY